MGLREKSSEKGPADPLIHLTGSLVAQYGYTASNRTIVSSLSSCNSSVLPVISNFFVRLSASRKRLYLLHAFHTGLGGGDHLCKLQLVCILIRYP